MSNRPFPASHIQSDTLTMQQYETSMYFRAAASPIEDGREPLNQLFATARVDRDASWNSAGGSVPCNGVGHEN